jgi:ABC-type transport system involved in multi-copper enzyme maturation permease subunit
VRIPIVETGRRVFAIARNTFIEAVRNRAFLGLGIAAIGMVVFSIALSGLALSDQRDRVLLDFGLFAIALLEVVIAITMGVILVFKEVDRKTFYVVLTKPIRRSEVILGKWIGLVSVLAIALVVMSAAWILSLVSREVPLRADMLPALVLIWFQAALVTAIALFFSSFASPILSGVFTFGTYVVGSTLYILQELLEGRKGMLAVEGPTRTIAEVSVQVFPDLSVFNMSRELILDIPIGWGYVGSAGFYCAAWCLVILGLAMLVFQQRDFT